MPGWSVVLKKEPRSRRISSIEDEHGLNEEVCSDDLQLFLNMDPHGSGSSDNNADDEAGMRQSNGRRMTWDQVN